ncbi:MAG: hypothetical protein IJA69_00335 [Clostridia bacterium]|nr:hypothetical protein [Clostridia bacterium]
MFGRNKSTRESTKNCSSKASQNVEAGTEMQKSSSSRKGKNKGAKTKNSRG